MAGPARLDSGDGITHRNAVPRLNCFSRRANQRSGRQRTIIGNLADCRHGIDRLKLPFSLFLALRYLKPKRTFLSIITLISVVGVMLGVTVLILVIAVMTGFDRELRQKVLDFDAHVVVTTQEVLNDWRDITTKIQNTPGVTATAPFVQGPVIVDFEGHRMTPLIRGIDPAQEEKVIPIQKF